MNSASHDADKFRPRRQLEIPPQLTIQHWISQNKVEIAIRGASSRMDPPGELGRENLSQHEEGPCHAEPRRTRQHADFQFEQPHTRYSLKSLCPYRNLLPSSVFFATLEECDFVLHRVHRADVGQPYPRPRYTLIPNCSARIDSTALLFRSMLVQL